MFVQTWVGSCIRLVPEKWRGGSKASRSFNRFQRFNAGTCSFLVGGFGFEPLRLPANGSGRNGKSRERTQARFQLRNMDTRPMTAATVPPMSIQIALSVGEPLKNRDTSELKEFVALMPMTMSTTPPMSRAREIILFIKTFQ
jgi:hypothetical protein